MKYDQIIQIIRPSDSPRFEGTVESHNNKLCLLTMDDENGHEASLPSSPTSDAIIMDSIGEVEAPGSALPPPRLMITKMVSEFVQQKSIGTDFLAIWISTSDIGLFVSAS